MSRETLKRGARPPIAASVNVLGSSLDTLPAYRSSLSSVSKHEHQEGGHNFDRLSHLINERFDKVMSAIADFGVKLTAFFDRQDTAITDLQGDVKNLQDQIAALQNSTGTITPEDQAVLDGIQARASTISDKLDALDALTPPKAPTGP